MPSGMTPRKLKAAITTVLLAGAVIAVVPPNASATNCQSWGLQPPNVGSGLNELSAVDVVSPCRAWGVGNYNNGSIFVPLIEEWTGSRWRVQSTPDLGGDNGFLYGVAATSVSNAWAVGYHYSPSTALIERWNGTKWKIQTIPTLPTGTESVFRGVTATSATNAWAVGNKDKGAGNRTLIMHWNGMTWKIQSTPNPPGDENTLFGVTALSPTDAWAVGKTTESTGAKPLVLHWNGTRWRVQGSPSTISGDDNLYSVVATSRTNAWAVGADFNATPARTLILHWNGRTWKRQPHPAVASDDNVLYGVEGTSARNAWAVGYFRKAGASRTLILRWNGTAWKVRPSPNLGDATQDNSLSGVAASSPTNAWAVGFHREAVSKNLALHCC